MNTDTECEVCGQRPATSQVEWEVNGVIEEHFYCDECYLKINPSETYGKKSNYYSEIRKVNEEDDDFDDDGLDENGVPYDCNSSSKNESKNSGFIQEFSELPDFLGDLGGLIACQIYGLEKVKKSAQKPKRTTPKKDIPIIYCPNCGLSFEKIRKTQKAGCQKCYDTFSGVLMQKHRRFSDGKDYCGKEYKSKLILSDIDYMQNELNTAVKNQDFERAAYLRDEMNELRKKASVENE